METVVNKLEKSMVEVKATFSKEEWKDAQDRALNKVAANANLDGFRKGKAPKALIKAKVGTKALLAEAVDEILSTSYAKVFVENNITPVAQPEANVEVMTEDELKITFTAPVAPEVELKQYKGLEAKKKAVRVTSKEVDERLASYQNEFAELELKEDGEVEDGDTANIDFEGFKDGVAFEGGKGENYPLEIGSGSFIPGFEEQLIGMKVGEEKEINVKFPEEYQAPELAGADATFKVKVHEIKTKILPALDDELAKDVNIEGVETLDQLKNHIKEDIRAQKKAEAERKFDEDVFEAVVEANPVEVPQAMVDTEVQTMVSEMTENLSRQGLNMDLYTQLTGQSLDDMKAQMADQAEKRVKFQLIIDAVVKAENIEVTDEELDEQYKEIAAYYSRDVEEIKKIFAGQEYRVKADVANKKAVDFIKENVSK
ncbi:MAG TPA: trigger factor [Kandleria vitulina]|nr:trigger factor [Kandleria vitulina]HAH76039.1 trigger factor [Kandleria vitulina]HCY53561.1 trigger factor [Kandleria vitulina]